MAFIYHALFHTLTTNGEKILVGELDWGERKLTGDDLAIYRADMAEAVLPIDNAINEGKLVITPLEGTVTSPEGQQSTTIIGNIFTFPGATTKFEFHPNFAAWIEVMMKDTDLQYNHGYWIDETP